jgi:hypothetical protein
MGSALDKRSEELLAGSTELVSRRRIPEVEVECASGKGEFLFSALKGGPDHIRLPREARTSVVSIYEVSHFSDDRRKLGGMSVQRL